MSVFGVDFGNLNSTVAITRYGGVDVVTNEVSKRETTTIVSFLKDERFIGEQGLDRYVRNAQNTIFLIKRFIGMRTTDPAFEQEKRFLTCKTSEGKDHRIMFDVNYCDDVISFYPEQVLAMMLQKLRSYVNEAGTVDSRYPADIRDCVITVPGYFNADQRRLMYQAAEMAGLHCMSLINETTAAAVDYGIFRGATLKETEAEGQTVGIFDIGYGATSFTVYKFWRGNCRVLSRVYDRVTGTRDFDYALFDHFVDEVRSRYHVNVRGNGRAELRLLQACERIKYLLSANQSAPLNVENLMDIDVNIAQFERATFESISAPVLLRMRAVLERGLAECGVTAEAFHSVEMIGGGSRIPAVKRLVDEVFKRSPSFTLNASETTARGAAIMAAMLSPKFQVREFKVAELATFPIKLGYQVQNPKAPCALPFAPHINKCVTLLGAKDHYPKLLDVTVPLTTPFEMTAFYDPESAMVQEYVRDNNYVIAEWRVDRPTKKLSSSSSASATVPEEREVKVRINIRPDGVLYVDHAWAVMVHEEGDPAPTANSNSTTTTNNTTTNNANEASQSQQADETASGRATGDGMPEAASPASPADASSLSPSPSASTAPPTSATAPNAAASTDKPRKVIRRQLEVPVTAKDITVGHHETEVRGFAKHESQMFSRDKQILQTREKKNELESYILNYRPRLSAGGDLADYITPSDRDSFLAQCDADENWLYEDSDTATLADFEDHVQALRRIGDAAERRHRTRDDLAFEINTFTQKVQTARESALSKLGSLPHVSDDELRAAAATADEALSWAQGQMQQLQQMPKTADPPAAFSVEALRERANTVSRGVSAVVSRPLPPPPKPAASTSSADAPKSSPTSSNKNAPGAGAASMQNEEEGMEKEGSGAESSAQAGNGQPPQQRGAEEDEMRKERPAGESAAGGSASMADNEELD